MGMHLIEQDQSDPRLSIIRDHNATRRAAERRTNYQQNGSQSLRIGHFVLIQALQDRNGCHVTKIPSGSRLLDAYLVEAAPGCRPRAALLIFHGVGETVSQWVNVQRLLYDHCISSVVFDYSGNGDSSPPGTVRNLHEDAIAAYTHFHTRFAGVGRVCTLGFSMGNAVLLEAYTQFHTAPDCMIVGGAGGPLKVI